MCAIIGVLKRATRHSRNMEGRSWLGDSQMHKVGYPNLNVGYSEEDSRDAADVHENVEVSSVRIFIDVLAPLFGFGTLFVIEI